MTKQKVRMCMEYASAVVLAVCTGGTVAGAGNVRVVDCKGREFAAPLGWNYEPGGLIYPVIAALAAEEGQEWESLGSALASGRGEVFEDWRKKDILNNWSDWNCSLKTAVAKGQCIRLDSLQIARSYAVFANLGTFIGSYGVERMVGADGKVLKCHEQSTVRRVLNAEIAGKVCRALEKSVAEGGCCQDAKVDGLRVAGMSGTASLHFEPKSQMVVNGRSFAGFFPS